MPERRDRVPRGRGDRACRSRRRARGTRAVDTVATTGVCEVFPGAINSVPSRARLDVDVRIIDLARRDSSARAPSRARSDEAAGRRGVTVRLEPINADPPASCAQTIVGAITAACEARGLSHRPMISRAYHDSLFMSGLRRLE